MPDKPWDGDGPEIPNGPWLRAGIITSLIGLVVTWLLFAYLLYRDFQ